MNNRQLEEKKYYEEDELDLLDLVRTIVQHRVLIIVTTIIFMIVALFGGYAYNRSKSVTTAIISLDYPGRESGQTPLGGVLTPDEILPEALLNSVYDRHKDHIKAKTRRDFLEEFHATGMIPKYIQKKIENSENKGEKYIYTPTEFKISSSENKKIMDLVVNDIVVEFIRKYRPYNVVDPLEVGKNYDYPVIYQIVDAKIDTLKILVKNREKENFISKKSGISFDKINADIKNLENIELQDYYSYYSGHHLSLDATGMRIKYNSKILVLKGQLEGLENQAGVLNELLNGYKGKNYIITDIEKANINQKDETYGNLLEQYIAVNKEINGKKIAINKIETDNKELWKYPSEEEKNILNDKLDKLVTKLNNIISEINILEEEYISNTYANMITISSPVIVTTSGKPLYMYLIIGLILGGCFGVFLAFASEFKKDYKKRYGK